MRLRLHVVIIASKLLRLFSQLAKTGGSAFPGILIERYTPDLLRDFLGALPDGVILVTGTNGKTSTAKVIAAMFEAAGKRVVTNRTGSNFIRGIAAATLQEVGWLGKNPDCDIAVFEVDEAYGSKLVEFIAPRITVALNISRDQLDRFVELDMTAGHIANTLAATTEACVLNADDPNLLRLAHDAKATPHFFGAAQNLQSLFPSDQELSGVISPRQRPPTTVARSVVLESIDDRHVTYTIGDEQVTDKLRLEGAYNYLNGAAALAAVKIILPEVPNQQLVRWLAAVKPAFGRGETIKVGHQTLELMLVKNPASFRQVLAGQPSPATMMICLNDNFADGRDISWIWDVDFTRLQTDGPVLTGGRRAHDMAVRLIYDEIEVGLVEPDLRKALQAFLQLPSTHKRLFCTYTAMLSLRKILASLTPIEKVI